MGRQILLFMSAQIKAPRLSTGGLPGAEKFDPATSSTSDTESPCVSRGHWPHAYRYPPPEDDIILSELSAFQGQVVGANVRIGVSFFV